MGIFKEDDNLAILNYIEKLDEQSFLGYLQSVVFDAPSIGHDSINVYFTARSDVNYFSHVFREGDLLSPYYPFLVCIREHFSSEPKTYTISVLKKLNIYKLHRDMYVAFIYDEEYVREPEVMRDEVYFEQFMIKENIVKLIDYISSFKDMVIYLGNLHLAGESTIELMDFILTKHKELDILLITSFDTDTVDFDDEDNVKYRFLETIEHEDILVRIEAEYFDESSLEEERLPLEEEIFKVMNEAYNFLAIEDNIRYAMNLYIDYNNNLKKGEEKQFIQLLRSLGRAQYLTRDSEGALFYLNMGLSLATDSSYKKEICDLKVRLGYVYNMRNDFTIARKHAMDALEIAIELEDEGILFKCKFLQFIIDRDSLYSDGHSDKRLIDELVDMAKGLGYYNYLSVIYTNPQELHDNYNKEKEEYFIQGIEIAKELGNSHQLSVAYHNQGIGYSRIGENDLAYEYYRKSQEIKERIGDVKRVAYIHNSLGYYYFMIEEFNLANSEYIKSFVSASKTRDYHEICMTLYNMALNAFFAGRYEIVVNYTGKILRLMKIAKVGEMKYHSNKMVYDLYIIALVKSDQLYKAKDIYNKAKIWDLKPIEGKTEEYFISEMMEYFITVTDEVKEEILMGAEEYIGIDAANMTHFRKFYLLEKLLYYKEAKSNYYKKVGNDFLEELDDKSPKTRKQVECLIDKDVSECQVSKEAWQDVENEYNNVLYTAKIDQNLLKLKNRINEISFLNIVQNMLVNEGNVKQVVLRLQQLIHGNTKVEKTYCRMVRSKGMSKLNIENSKLVINEVYADRIFSYVKDRSKAGLIHIGNSNLLTLKKVYGYSSLMYLPVYVNGKRRVEFIFMTQRQEVKLNQDDLSIFTLVGRQVGENIERIENTKTLRSVNEKLSHLSRTDILTDLNNRNALEEEMQLINSRLIKGKLDELIVLFIDLDNFKYYNDTFGHAIGDQVLVYFASILKGVGDDETFIARFGGDEFVMLFSNKSPEAVEQVVEAIYNKIKEFYYFERIIGQILGKKVVIPEEARLSCSIGMTCYDENKALDVYDLFKLSDSALYKAKREGKNRLEKSEC